ncbi:S66 peptidase family protein [Singulisphaera acidiphila]|uniref:Putative MccF-like protein (Microcin C7 resistance) n=2 Tax=Singulisphaera acidiphila TaxID=466153 RepID=L0DGL4_SINAD|nr:LD-carboxypeptidase [Singulisphaera acidiphila]AGA27816.1 putative MccF-like protein (microcin C7 resistance) [Singulisphaera acidiphila DSM 18658]
MPGLTMRTRFFRCCLLWAWSGFAGMSAAVAADDKSTLEWLNPPALKPGDTIAFAAPAGPAVMAPLREYAKTLEKAGYKVIIPKGIEERGQGYLGGTDDQRADELNKFIRDPKVRAIFPVRGGYGLTRIIDRIDYAALRKDPKIIIGYSDLTALHLAVAHEARVITFHSPMPMAGLGENDKAEYTFAGRAFRRAVFADQYRQGQQGFVVATPEDRKPETLVKGKASGRLLGGNLTLICSTLGTPYAIQPKGAILFIEDVNEAPYRVDRSLSQLRLAGILDQVAGVVVGSFTSKEPAEREETDRVLREYFAKSKVPVILNYPIGHTPLNATVPHGGLVELDADEAVLKVLENPVRLDNGSQQ